MSIFHRSRRAVWAALGAATLFGVLSSVAVAAFAAPFVAYGTAATPGTTVSAFIGTTQVGSTTVTADGAWVIQITQASTGDVISFKVNGVAQVETLVAEEAGAPGGGLNAGVSASTGLLLTPVAVQLPVAPPPSTLLPGLNPTMYGPGSVAGMQAHLLAIGGESVTVIVDGRPVGIPASAPTFVVNALGIPAGFFDTPRIVLIVKL